MTKMTDPYDALKSFQQAYLNGQIQLKRGDIDRELFVHVDHPTGTPRFTYVKLEGQTVTALVMLVVCEPLSGVPCFQVGYAVPAAYRGEGRAKNAVAAAIAELKQGLARNKISTFYMEGIVGADNEASKRVAAATISNAPAEVTDCFSGLPALQYLRKIGEDTVS